MRAPTLTTGCRPGYPRSSCTGAPGAPRRSLTGSCPVWCDMGLVAEPPTSLHARHVACVLGFRSVAATSSSEAWTAGRF